MNSNIIGGIGMLCLGIAMLAIGEGLALLIIPLAVGSIVAGAKESNVVIRIRRGAKRDKKRSIIRG